MVVYQVPHRKKTLAIKTEKYGNNPHALTPDAALLFKTYCDNPLVRWEALSNPANTVATVQGVERSAGSIPVVVT